MQNSEYWKLRFEQLEASQNGQGAAAVAEIERQYKEAQKQIEGQIARWYQRFADNNGIGKCFCKVPYFKAGSPENSDTAKP